MIGDDEEVVRAHGNIECSACGKTYWRHPRPDDEIPTVRRLCDGRLVKL